MVAHDVELRRVPDLQHEQHGREHERAQHRPRAPGRRAPADRRGRQRGGDDDPDRADDLGTGGGVELRRHQNERISGRTPRRMSARLRVSCWTGSAPASQPRAPLGQPDADDDALAELGERERRARRSAAPRRPPPLRDGLLVDDGERDLVAIARLGLLQLGEAREPLDAGEQAGVALVGDGLQRPVRAGPAQRVQPRAERVRVASGRAAAAGGRGATSTPRRSESAPNERDAAALGRVARAGGAPARSAPSAAGRRARRPRARPSGRTAWRRASGRW